jgi:hypothetical protein
MAFGCSPLAVLSFVFASHQTDGEGLPDLDYSPAELPPLIEVAGRLCVALSYLPLPADLVRSDPSRRRGGRSCRPEHSDQRHCPGTQASLCQVMPFPPTLERSQRICMLDICGGVWYNMPGSAEKALVLSTIGVPRELVCRPHCRGPVPFAR